MAKGLNLTFLITGWSDSLQIIAVGFKLSLVGFSSESTHGVRFSYDLTVAGLMVLDSGVTIDTLLSLSESKSPLFV